MDAVDGGGCIQIDESASSQGWHASSALRLPEQRRCPMILLLRPRARHVRRRPSTVEAAARGEGSRCGSAGTEQRQRCGEQEQRRRRGGVGWYFLLGRLGVGMGSCNGATGAGLSPLECLRCSGSGVCREEGKWLGSRTRRGQISCRTEEFVVAWWVSNPLCPLQSALCTGQEMS
jgi:hypothetical protein